MDIERYPHVLDEQIDVQCADADFFVGRIEDYAGQVQASKPRDIYDDNFLGAIVSMQEIIRVYHVTENLAEKLLLAEDLSDLVNAAVDQSRELSRSPAADALLDFRAPHGNRNDTCTGCQNRPPVFSLESREEVCVRCFFAESD